MASFKEIKKRINAVKSTQKTTSAMKMVASSKLRKAENLTLHLHPYSVEVNRILSLLLTYENATKLSIVRPVQNVAIIAFSSDSSLCGAYNSNVLHKLHHTINQYKKTLDLSHIHVYTIGKKVYESFRKSGIPIASNFEGLAGKTDYARIAEFASTLITQFEKNQIDRIEMIFHHFKSAGAQELVVKQLLPIVLPVPDNSAGFNHDFILEPSAESLLTELIPKAIKLQLYTALLNSNASEHAARMIAMQTATDNANKLDGKLTIQYNKYRQQVITAEILALFGSRT